MSLLRELFGPSKEEIWQQLAAEIGANFVDGGFWGKDVVQAKHREWTITLDTYTVSSGKSSTTYTRIRAPYINKDCFYFTIYQKSIFSALGKFFGMQDVEVGYPQFDEDFIIKGNDEQKLRSLFANSTIRELIQLQQDIHLEVKDAGGYFGESFPEGVDQLYFEVPRVIKNVETLKSLYMLFAETLNHLCHIGSAYEDDPLVNV